MLVAVLIALWVAGTPVSIHASDTEPGESKAESTQLLRLRQATAQYPDDPNLAWALVRQLLNEGHAEAEAELRTFQQRWPRHQPEAGIHLGRILFEAERFEESLASLDQALAIDPKQAAGHIYRGLVLHRLKRTVAARKSLDEAVRLSPELRPEVARLRADMSPPPETPAPLESTETTPVELSASVTPASELDRGERGLEKPSFSAAHKPASDPLRFFASVGGEWDSNPDRQGRQGVREPADADFKGHWELGLSYQDRGNGEEDQSAWIPQLGAAYRFQGEQYDQTHDRNNQRHQGLASARWRISPRVTARSLGLAGYDWRAGRSYRWFVLKRPSLTFTASPKWGTSEVFGSVEYTQYFDDSNRSSFDLDGWEWGFGFRHRVRVPKVPKARATLGLRYSELDTESSRDAMGFESPYDNRSLEGRVGLEVILPWEVRADLAGSAGHAWYAHRNAIDFELGGSGDARRDTWFSWRAALRRPLNRLLDFELSYRGIDSESNVRSYDYTRHTIGFEIGVVWDYTPGRRAE